jgi:ribosomal-protein-alanine N-acetyltransferase
MRFDDLAGVVAIEQQAYDFPWTEGIFRDCLRVGYCCRVLEEAGELLGYGVMSVGAGESHLLNVCVLPDAQGKGLGRLLLDHMVSIARRYGVESVLLEVRPSNKRAIHLYHKLGFNEVGIRKGYYPDVNGREDALILALAL